MNIICPRCVHSFEAPMNCSPFDYNGYYMVLSTTNAHAHRTHSNTDTLSTCERESHSELWWNELCVNNKNSTHTHTQRQFKVRIAQLNFKFIARIISSMLKFSRFQAKTFGKIGGSFISVDFTVFICSSGCLRA